MVRMPARRILELGDPMLRRVSEEVPRPEEAKLIVRDLRATLHQFQTTHGFGRGISAIQIGEPKRIIYIETGGASHVLLNPRLQWQSEEKFLLWDDCFSFPDLLVWVERAVSLHVRSQDLSGNWNMLEATGPFSELLQHELDHLDGILAVDRAVDKTGLCTRAEYERRYGPPARNS